MFYLTIYCFYFLIAIIFKIYKSNKLLPVFFFITIGFISEISIEYLSLNGISNHWVVNLYIIPETILPLFAIKTWVNEHKTSKWIKLFILIYLISWLYSCLTTDFKSVFYWMIVLQSIGVTVFCGMYQIKLSRDSRIVLTNAPTFWISSGFLIYFGSSMILHSGLSLISNEAVSKILIDIYYTTLIFINVVSFSLISWGFLHHHRLTKNTGSFF
jgi:hypothetical protein